ncbi:hypothetical protein DY327_005405, partial [Escherichia coli]|nr:hypothetical protein [Escherichia coli]
MTFLKIYRPTRSEWECRCSGSSDPLVIAANIIGILHLILWITDR